MSQSAPQVGEVGETVNNNLTASFARGDAGALTAISIRRNSTLLGTAGTTSPLTRSSSETRIAGRISYAASVSYAAGVAKNVPPANTPDDRAPQIRSANAPQAAETGLQSNEVYLDGSYAVFFGPTATVPASGTDLRTLSGYALVAQSGSQTLNTGTTQTKQVIALPPGKTLQSVTDLDNQNLNLTAKYVLQGTLTGQDAGGNSVPGYSLYVLTTATPYTTSARHLFTYA